MKLASLNQGYTDSLARQRKRRFFLKIMLVLLSAGGFCGFAIYLLFLSPLMRIDQISINNLKTLDATMIHEVLDPVFEKSILNIPYLKPYRNIIFFNPDTVKDEILTRFQVIGSLDIKKEYFHKLVLDFKERTPIGTWCLPDRCFYFDEDGILWGKSLKSSGSLLLTVDDMRTGENMPRTADIFFWPAVKKTINELEGIGLKIRRVEIPSDSLTDFRIYPSKGYYILFDIESDIERQVEALTIFLDSKGQGFDPQYIDARIDGRIYYK